MVPSASGAPSCGQVGEAATTSPDRRRASSTRLRPTRTSRRLPGGSSSERRAGASAAAKLAADVGAHEPPRVRRLARGAATEMTRGTLAEELGEPGFVLYLLVEDGQRKVVG